MHADIIDGSSRRVRLDVKEPPLGHAAPAHGPRLGIVGVAQETHLHQRFGGLVFTAKTQGLAHEQQAPGLLGSREHLSRILVAGGHRFLAQHMRSGSQRGQRPWFVVDVGGAYRDHVEFLGIQHALRIVRPVGNAVRLGGATSVARHHVRRGDDLHLIGQSLPGGHVSDVADHPGADQAHTQLTVGHRALLLFWLWRMARPTFRVPRLARWQRSPPR